MYILPQERPQNVNYGIVEFLKNDWDTLQICVRCKHSKPNMSYPKDEMDCIETGGICNALCTCDRFEEDC